MGETGDTFKDDMQALAEIKRNRRMGMYGKLFVRNLPYKTTPRELTDVLLSRGLEVVTASVVTDPQGKPRGYGFVEVPAGQVDRAIKALNGAVVMGRTIGVERAMEKPRR